MSNETKPCWVFDASKATAGYKRLLPNDHIEAIEGKTVVFDNKGLGWIRDYVVNGEHFYLYPIYRSQCRIKELTLF